MEAKLRMRVEYDEPFSNELEAPFVNVLPNEPLEAYKHFDQQKLGAIRQTQKIPFSSLRQLILMYILQSGSVVDVQQSELLKEKLCDEAYSNDHHSANSAYDQLLKEKERLQKLHEVTHKYIEMREKLVSNELRRTMHRRYDGSELGSLLSSLEQRKDSEMRQLQQSVEQSAKSGVKVDAEKEKRRIEEQYNHEVLLMFEDQLPKLQKLSAQFHQNLENVNWFKLYIEDFEKALVFIISARKINNRVGRRAEERLLKDSFEVQLARSISELGHMLDCELQRLFDWRNSVKYGRAGLQQKQVELSCGAWRERLEQNVYELIPEIISILKADRETIKLVESQISKQYSLFLSGYYDAKEVALFYKKESKIEEVLEKERQLLIDHLKKNYSMMVFYSKSPDYVSCIEDYKAKSKGYLKDILNKKVALLDTAITFINKQYAELYKEACEGRSGTRDRILNKCRSLEEGLKESQTILTLLMESCRRLLNIASK